MAGAFPNADGQGIAQAMQAYLLQQAQAAAMQPRQLAKPMPVVQVTGTPPPELTNPPEAPLPAPVVQAAPPAAPIPTQALPEPGPAPIESRAIPPAPAPAAVPAGESWQFPSVPQEAMGGLLRAGLELMQPMPMWQTAAGHMARAAMSGVDYTNQQKKDEAARVMQEAQVAQTKAQTQGTLAGVDQTKASTKQTEATTDKILQELEDTKKMGDLKVDELKGKIELAKTSGVLNEAQAKALADKIENDPDYRKAAIEEMKARAYYYRNPQLRAGASGGDPAIVRTVEARVKALKQINGPAMSDAEAQAIAWREVGMGSAGGKDLATEEEAQRTLSVLKSDYEDEMAGVKPKDKVPFNTWLRTWQENIMPGSAQEKIAVRVREMARQGSNPQAPAGGQAPAAAATPVPTKIVNGAKKVDRDKLVPGQSYVLPDGSTGVFGKDFK